MPEIKTKSFNYGDANEGTWPPQFGTGGAGVYHIDEETGKAVEGYPPRKTNYFGQAPMVMFDDIKPYRHPATGQVITSLKALKETDKACGTVTVGKMDDFPADTNRPKRLRQEIREDRRRARQRAIADIDNGNAPLTEEQKAKCVEQNEILSKALNFDAFNVAGRKDDERGKRFRRG